MTMLLAMEPLSEAVVQQAAFVEIPPITAATALAIPEHATHRVQQLRMEHVDRHMEEQLAQILHLAHALQSTASAETIRPTVAPETATQAPAKILVTSPQTVPAGLYSLATKHVQERNSEAVVQLLDIAAALAIIAGQAIVILEPVILVLLLQSVLMALVGRVRRERMSAMVRSLALVARRLDFVGARVITVRGRIAIREHVQARESSI